MPATKTLPLLLACLLWLAVAPCQAQERKTDVITLYNGDKVTGEIKSMEGGILELSTDAIGTIGIEWPEIAHLQSDYHYELRLSDGQRLYGSIQRDSRAGQLVLTDIYGRHPIDLLQVVEVRPIEDSFVDRLNIYFSATVAYTKATSVGQVSFNTNINYEDKTSSNTLSARTDLSRTDDNDSKSTTVNLSRNTWSTDRGSVYRALFASYETNDELALTRRVGVGAGVGRYFIDTHRSTLTGTAGLQVIDEDSEGEKTTQDVELILNTHFATWRFSSPELDIDFDFTLYPSVTDEGRVRSSSNVRLRWELLNDLYWDVTAWANTDNQSATGSDTDYAITTGIGWNN
ncbi:DUF481 domain-containing protein [Mangrovimicrobium sediminis]|uniref:DUF481 domain-containing protein n=1 Tax=Mangrovimicrobium sediminis TaxID=2562682 RepID=UPI00197E6AD3|nr:DUF481 domain-containing protein [Haliea sp. SAOS-164]